MKIEKLSCLEILLYYLFLIFGIIYSTYQVFLTGDRIVNIYTDDMPDGWSFLSRKKDDTDEEWRTWIRFILLTISPWILVHYTGARLMHKFAPLMLSTWYTFITSTCVIMNYGIPSFLVLVGQPIFFFLLIQVTRSRIKIWLTCYILSYIFTHEKSIPIYYVTYEDLNFLIPTLMWIYLRCISYCMCVIEKPSHSCHLLNFLGYVFYLPCFFLGPVLLFEDFVQQVQHCKWKKLKAISLQSLIAQNFRYLFWIFMAELFLHYIYVNYLLDYIDSFVQINRENVWVMYGMGFWMGQFFFIKYFIVYGLALTWTRAEGYQTPDPPKCIAYVYLYSDMWRNFDRPLYNFIKRHIYEPCWDYMPRGIYFKKTIVSFLCFFFVYVWHGLDYSIFMWSFLNYFGIITETIAKYLSKTKLYQLLRKTLGLANERRMVGLLCAPLIIISAISNFYFLGGATVAETYFQFIFIRGTKSTLSCLWLLLYVSCQVSMEMKREKGIQKPITLRELIFWSFLILILYQTFSDKKIEQHLVKTIFENVTQTR